MKHTPLYILKVLTWLVYLADWIIAQSLTYYIDWQYIPINNEVASKFYAFVAVGVSVFDPVNHCDHLA